MPENGDLVTIQISAEKLGLLMHILANVDVKLGSLDLIASKLGGIEGELREMRLALKRARGEGDT